MTEWVEVKSFSNKVEAEIVKSALENFGIKAQISADVLGGVPLPGMLMMVRILVPKEQLHEAKKLLRNHKS